MNPSDLSRAVWKKSTRSSQSGQCVEVAQLDGATAVRDSKLSNDSPVLIFTPEEWAAFIDGAKSGEFDRP